MKPFVLPLITALLAATAVAPAGSPSASTFQADLLNDLGGTRHHLEQLAEAIPAEKYTWRPQDGVRSVSEVFIHIAAANYLLLSVAGMKLPAEYFPGVAASDSKALHERMIALEKEITQKSEVQRMLKDSLVQFQDHFSALAPSDLDKPVDFFGSKSSVRAVYLRIFAHNNEHYGQLVGLCPGYRSDSALDP